MPESLDELTGSLVGVVTLPLRLSWSGVAGERAFDVAIDHDRRMLYEVPAERLLDLDTEKDPGFDRRYCASALRSVTRLVDDDFTALGLSSADVAALRDQVVSWAARLEADDDRATPA